MPKYINADKEIQEINEVLEYERTLGYDEKDIAYYAFKRFAEVLKKAPAADVQEIRHAMWIKKRKFLYECSLCKRVVLLEGINESCDDKSARKIVLDMYPYCNCGAKMDIGTK